MPNKLIKILHISDLHYSESKKDALTRRLTSLFSYLDKYQGEIDLVVFTGDLSQSGSTEELESAFMLLFEKLKARLHVSKNDMFIVAGNHDICRSAIDKANEALLIEKLNTSIDAEKYLYILDKRSDNFRTFQGKHFKHIHNSSNHIVCDVKGLKIGISCLDSAWRCSGIKDFENLFITEKQYEVANSVFDSCAVKICLLHHPFNFLHKSESSSIVNDIKRIYNLVLTGHLHENKAVNEISPAYNSSLVISAPSIFNTENRPLGFNLYTIDYENKKLLSSFFKYFRNRDSFDKDTEQADDGKYEFNLNVADSSQFAKHLICQKITTAKSQLQLDIKKQLCTYQQLETPIIVKQKVAAVNWSENCKKHSNPCQSYSDIYKSHSVIFAHKDMGKTIFSQNLISSINESASSNSDGEVGLYLNLEYKFIGESDLIKMIELRLADIGISLDHGSLILCLDHVYQNDFTQFSVLNNIGNIYGNIKFIVSLNNSLLFETLNKQKGFSAWDQFEILNWGPSTIREYIIKYLEIHGSNVDIEVAFSFITNSLKDSDLPSNPVNITLYLSIIPILKDRFSSLSFLHLLEKIEQIKLESIGGAPEHALYNKREVLAHIAYSCLDADDGIKIPYTKALECVAVHFGKSSLTVDSKAFLKDLSKSGIIDVDPDFVSFRHYIFLDFFLARAYDAGIISLLAEKWDLHKYICLGKSLALFCGIKRTYHELIYNLIDKIEPAFDKMEDFRLLDLDRYIHDLLLPIDHNASADDIAKEDINHVVDYEAMDNEYHADKENYVSNRKQLAQIEEIKTDLDAIVNKISGLQVLYNCFRNLENISTDNKLLLLNQILDFHICCNLDLINYLTKHLNNKDYHTLVAYFATMSGQEFLSDNIGNQSLEPTFNNYLELCDNDFKKLLIICLMADLKLDNYSIRLRNFAETTKSRAAVEIIYFKLRDLIINTESRKVPAELVSAFKVVFDIRHKLTGAALHREIVNRLFVKELETAKAAHLQTYSDTNI